MSNDTFLRSAPEVAVALMAKHVRGVFEARTPLAVEAALEAGCVAAVARHAQRRPLGEGFDLAELQVRKESGQDTTEQMAYG